jgi:hypothetical protein
VSRWKPHADHYDQHLKGPECERAEDATLPLLDRLVAAAHCRRRRNGHSRFGRRELALLLDTSRRQPDGTERRGVDRRYLNRLIERAVLLGRLEPGSCAACLVVSGVTGGVGGSAFTECAVRDQHCRVAARHRAVLTGARKSQAEAHAEREADRRRRKEQAMEQVTASVSLTEAEWAMVLTSRRERDRLERAARRERERGQVVVNLDARREPVEGES